MLIRNEASFDAKTVWGLIGIIPIATALVGFCPLYRLVGLSTCQVGGAGKQGA